MSPASDFSAALLTSFVRLGVHDIVLSPGSRSQALALVAAELESAGAVRLHVRIDERVAGFLALGLAVESRMPALVITTSGTATANLHPAVLEAHHSGVPMILLTADRPTELRGIRSNQTTVQPGMYGEAVRLCEDVPAPVGDAREADAAVELASRALDAALGTASREPGPVQLNLAFREPLSSVVSVPELAEGRGTSEAPLTLVEEPRGAGVSKPRHDAGTETRRGPSLASSLGAGVTGSLTRSSKLQRAQPAESPITIPRGPRTVVIAGHGAGPDAEELAHAGGWPLIAEVSSGARFGRNLIVAYRELLVDPQFGGRVERAIVFGHPTLSREIPALLICDGVEVVVVAPTGDEFYNPGRRVAAAVSAVSIDPDSPAPDDARAWLGSWVLTSRSLREKADAAAGPDHIAPDVDASRSHVPADRIAFARAEFAAVRAVVTRDMLVEALWRFTWPHDRLVFGASRLIRDADRAVPGKKIRVHSNRGLAGIDGTISTAIGIALASQNPLDGDGAAPGITRVLLGDLALLHDAGALLFGEGEARPNIQVVLGNDGGGTIFDALEVAFTASTAAFDRVMFTPQRADVAALASAYGWGYTKATTHGELDQALSSPAAGPSIVEVPLTR